MELSPATASLLSALDTLSAHTLARRADLGALLELGAVPGAKTKLEELSFIAKFVHRAHVMLARKGNGDEGYDRLAAEFSANMEKAVSLLTSMIEAAPPEVRARFYAVYLAMTQEAVAGLLELFHDLGWYKNWLIDTGEHTTGTT
jgi:hypothetical protein